MRRFISTSSFQNFAIGLTLFATIHGFSDAHAHGDNTDQPPAVGDMAPALELKGFDSETVKLEEVIRKGPVVVMVLRGNPGYQCPLCTRQVGEFIAAGKKLDAVNASVIMVYPGPKAGLESKAGEFLKGTKFPKGFYLLIDPDYAFTNDWHLRWDAPQETAYPSTFVVDKDGKIRLAKISKSHGDRASVEDVIKSLRKL